MTRVANNFQQNHFNRLSFPGIEPDAAERALAVDIEGPGAAAIDALIRVLGGGHFSLDQKSALSFLMATQLTRHPRWRDSVDDFMSRVLQLSLQMRAGAGEVLIDGVEATAAAQEMRRVAALLEHDEMTVVAPNEFHVMSSLEAVPDLVKYFFLGSWKLLVSETPWFVLPDAWVILERPADSGPFDGVGLLTSDRYVIPLDPFTCLEIEPLHARQGRPADPRVGVIDLTDNEAMRLAVLLFNETIDQFVEHPDLPSSAVLNRIVELYASDPCGMCYHTGQTIVAERIRLQDAVRSATWYVTPRRL